MIMIEERAHIDVLDIQDLGVRNQTLFDVLAHRSPKHVEGLHMSTCVETSWMTYSFSTPLPK
jgi:hypothetical protein